MRQIVFTLLALVSISVGHAASPPKPTKSEYLLSTGAGIALSVDDGARYGMNFAVLKDVPAPIYVTILFENPEKGGAPLRQDATLPAGATELVAKSERLPMVRNNKKYLVEVKLYSDEARAHLLGTHKQQVLFAVPKQLIQQIEQEFGTKIQ